MQTGISPKRISPATKAATATSFAAESDRGRRARRQPAPRRPGAGTGSARGPGRSKPSAVVGGARARRPAPRSGRRRRGGRRDGPGKPARSRSAAACRARPSGPSTLPSVNTTKPCATDVRWTSTWTRSPGTPNHFDASITSRPLFISVAESIVFLTPMRHVGCAARPRPSRAAIASRGADQNGPPDAVTTIDAIALGRRALQALKDRGVLAVDRQQPRAAARRVRDEQLARGDDQLLVRDRDVDAAIDRGEDRVERDGAVGRREHDVGAALARDAMQTRGTVARVRDDARARTARPARRAARRSSRPQARRRRSAPDAARSRRAPAARWSPSLPRIATRLRCHGVTCPPAGFP